jgi:hypothetical protein
MIPSASPPRGELEECNLHMIVRLSNGVFNPYTSINLTFFAKDVTSAMRNDYQRNPASRK